MRFAGGIAGGAVSAATTNRELAPVLGGDLGIRLEHQTSSELAITGDVAVGLRATPAPYLPDTLQPGFAPGQGATLVPLAISVGTQWNPGEQDTFALRPTFGVVVDSIGPGFNSGIFIGGLHATATLEGVMSKKLDDLEPWCSVRGGVIGGSTPGDENGVDGRQHPSFATSLGGALGVEYSFSETYAASAVLRVDGLVNFIDPLVVAGLQLGIARAF